MKTCLCERRKYSLNFAPQLFPIETVFLTWNFEPSMPVIIEARESVVAAHLKSSLKLKNREQKYLRTISSTKQLIVILCRCALSWKQSIIKGRESTKVETFWRCEKRSPLTFWRIVTRSVLKRNKLEKMINKIMWILNTELISESGWNSSHSQYTGIE